MTNFEYYVLFYDKALLYLLLLLVSAFFYYKISAKYTYTWFDPLRFTIITNVFSSTVILFLYFTENIAVDVFWHFIISITIFWLALTIFARQTPIYSSKIVINEGKLALILFSLFFALFISFTGATYALLGIPLFSDSRLETYAGSGMGVLGRMIPFFMVYCIFYIIYIWKHSSKLSLKRWLVVLPIVTFAVTGVLSGSRSSVLIFVFVIWGYFHFYERDTSKLKKYYKVVFLVILGSIFVSFSMKFGSANFIGIGEKFILRAISSGDNYYMALPNNIWEQVETGPWLKHLFYGLLGPLRIIGGDFMPPPVGYQLTWLVNPHLYGLATGPLSSPSLLGFIYFGWGGLFFSFVTGLFCSYAIFRLPYLFPRGIISSSLSIYIYLNMITFIGDVCLGMGYLFDTILNLVFVAAIVSIIYLAGVILPKRFFTEKYAA